MIRILAGGALFLAIDELLGRGAAAFVAGLLVVAIAAREATYELDRRTARAIGGARWRRWQLEDLRARTRRRRRG